MNRADASERRPYLFMKTLSAYYHLTKPAAVLRVTGPDAFAFLQSQFSNDLRRPGVERPVTYGLWLNQKGKIQADSFVIQRGAAEFLLVSYDCPAETIRAHLEAHLIADEVEVKDETGEFGLMHVFASEVIQEASDFHDKINLGEIEVEKLRDVLPTPKAANVLSWPGRLPKNLCSRDYLALPEELADFVKELNEAKTCSASEQMVRSTRIGHGIPAIPMDAGPGDLPQEAGLERDAVSFDKGCYLGQEVMARLKSQGQVNRALWVVQMNRGLKMPPNGEPQPLYAGDVVAGELRSRAWDTGLAMLKKRVIAGWEGLSLTPRGEEVVSLRAGDFARDLTAPVT
jgi:tRNA-modifying protein YgfZ